MKYCLSVLLTLSLCGMVTAQGHPAHPESKPATLMTGYGDLHHPVSTSNAQAQQFFDQGLRQIYAFNHDEAARSFQRATEYWIRSWPSLIGGVAEAVGPNYNDPASDDRFAAAHVAIQKAVEYLSASASPAEQAYIQAMALRFPADPKADRRKAAEAYHDAMRDVVKNFPDDLDAATLFAESAMDLHPWACARPMAPPARAPNEIVAMLEGGDTARSQSPGRIHYYIHAVEASNRIENALWPGPGIGFPGPGTAQDTWCTCLLTCTAAPGIGTPSAVNQ